VILEDQRNITTLRRFEDLDFLMKTLENKTLKCMQIFINAIIKNSKWVKEFLKTNLF
jgi:hypothetical protein